MTTLPDPHTAFDVPSFRPEMAFPSLTEEMIRCIRSYGTEAEYKNGTQVSTAGQREADMFVVLTGCIDVYTVDDRSRLESIIELGPLQFTGELNLLNDQPPLVSARATAPHTRLLRISRQNLRQLMRAEGDIANVITQAFIWRRIGLVSQTKTGVVLLGQEGEAETLKLQQFLSRNGYPYRLVQDQPVTVSRSTVLPGRDDEARPAIGLSDGRVLYRPAIPTLADELGITEIPDASAIYDVAVVGAGPAGLAAAVYAASEGLFVAALGNNTVEIIDVAAGKRTQTIHGLHEPQGVLYLSGPNRLYVANGDDGTLRIFDGSTYQPVATTKLGDDADNIRWDGEEHRIYVGYGSGALAGVDEKGTKLGEILLDAHPESFRLEPHATRIFVNLPDSRKIDVVDKQTKSVIASWHTDNAFANFPMALDETNSRLFVICRRPARLLVLDIHSGHIVGSWPTVGDCDDVFYDSATKRIYATGGAGAISVFQQQTADTYEEIATVPTRKGARTSFLSTETHSLYVAARAEDSQGAAILVYNVQQ